METTGVPMPVLTAIAIASAADIILPVTTAVGGSIVTSALWWWNGKRQSKPKSKNQERLENLDKAQQSMRIERELQAHQALTASKLHAASLATQTKDLIENVSASAATLARKTKQLDETTLELMTLPDLFRALSSSCEAELLPVINELRGRLQALSQSEDALLTQNQALGDKISELEHSLEKSVSTTQELEYDISENKRVVQRLNEQLSNLSTELSAYAELPIDDEEKEQLRSQNQALAHKLAEFAQKSRTEQRALIEKNEQLQQLILALTEAKKDSSSTAPSRRSGMTMF